jgi:hypothetical protein
LQEQRCHGAAPLAAKEEILMALLTFVRDPIDRLVGEMTLIDLMKTPIEFSEYTTSASASRIDLGRMIRMNSTGAMTVTLGASAANFGPTKFYVGETLFYVMWNTGAVTFAASGGASLASFSSLVAIEGRYGIVAATYTEGDVWWLNGRLA